MISGGCRRGAFWPRAQICSPTNNPQSRTIRSPLRGNNPQSTAASRQQSTTHFFSRRFAARSRKPRGTEQSKSLIYLIKKTNNFMQPATLSRRRGRRRRALEVVTTSKLHVNLRPSRQHTYVLRPRPNRGSHYLRPPPRLLCCALLIQCSRVVIARVQSS